MAQKDLRSTIQKLAIGFVICYTISSSDLSKFIHVEVGFHQYAELIDPTTFLKMPFNAIINIGYIVIGLYWLTKIKQTSLSNDAVYYFDVFSMMSIGYGPIQFLRITTQERRFAILDQWFTLPIFAWASLFGIFVINEKRQVGLESVILLMSVTSYGLSFITKHGFEIALMIHIICAVLIGLKCQYKIGSRKSLQILIYAVICCLGFVVLKIYDLHFVSKHWIFKRISGHFLSKLFFGSFGSYDDVVTPFSSSLLLIGGSIICYLIFKVGLLPQL